MKPQKKPFDTKAFLAKVGEGRSVAVYRKKQAVFSQGDAADSVFYIQKGKVKLSVVSKSGKEAVIAILGAAISSGRVASLGSRCAWRRLPPCRTLP